MPEANSLYDIRNRLEENFQRVQAVLHRIEQTDIDPRIQIAAAAELRHHIELANDTLASASRLEAVRAFEEAVMDALDKASVTLRKRVMEALDERGFAPLVEAEVGSAVRRRANAGTSKAILQNPASLCQ